MERMLLLTVDGDCNALGKDVAIAALEGGNSPQLVQLAIVVIHANTLMWYGLDEIDVEFVGFGNSQKGAGAWVVLKMGDQYAV